MATLKIEDIQKSSSRPKKVDIEDWGGSIKIRKMTVNERREFYEVMFNGGLEGNAPSVQAEIAFPCIVEPAFESVEQLRGMSGEGVKEAFFAITKYSGLGDSVDEAEGNSEETPIDSSSSD